MIFHENRQLADGSHEISYLIFFENWERCLKICRLLQSLLVLRVNDLVLLKIVVIVYIENIKKKSSLNTQSDLNEV